MPLPTLVTPEFRTKIPSTGEEIKYRPFLVKEEKLLFMANESDNTSDVVDAIKQILKNCILTHIEIDELASFDLEYLFLKLRSKSVGEVVEFKLKHQNNDECDHVTTVEVNLDTIEIDEIKKEDKIIELTDVLGIKMKYPSLKTIEEYDITQISTMDEMIELLVRCIDVVYDEETVYDNFTNKEMKEFIESFSTEQFAKVNEFINKMPKLRKEISYKCKKCGVEETRVIEGLHNFFT